MPRKVRMITPLLRPLAPRGIAAIALGAGLLLGGVPAGAAERDYNLAFSTYFGGNGIDQARDVFVDDAGNIYITGGSSSSNLPTTPGAYDRTYNTGGTQVGSLGECDVYVAKFSPSGSLLWSTYLGGPNYDRAYAIEVDRQGHVYVAGRAGPGFPTTTGAFQTQYAGRNAGAYGQQNAFVTKLAPDGGSVLWSSYVGVGDMCRDIAIDQDGDVYVPLGIAPTSRSTTQVPWMSTAFTNAFQKTPGGDIDCGIVKIAGDGSQVLWATWLGGSGKDTQEASIRVNADKQPYITFNTLSTNMATAGAGADTTHNGGEDVYLGKLSADGSTLIYGTFIGGSGNEWIVNTHNLALDKHGNAYVNVNTASTNFPTTAGVFDTTRSGANDIATVKVGPSGQILLSTLVGGNGADNPDGIYVSESGEVFFVGESSSTDFPTTQNAFQRTFGGNRDAVLVMLSADFTELVYSTYLGGSAYDNGRAAFLGSDGVLYLAGSVDGAGWPVLNAYQAGFAGGPGGSGTGDAILAKLVPIPEPAGALLALAAIGLLQRRRSRGPCR